MARRFFGKQIVVQRHEETRRPISFELDAQQHVIQEVMAYWHDYGVNGGGIMYHQGGQTLRCGV